MGEQGLNAQPTSGLKREIGLFGAIAIVVGQMIGSGIFMAPQGLAEMANPVAGILSLIITGIGSLLLALCFAKTAVRDNRLSTPLAATKEAFGELPAFWSGWAYWAGCWRANGTIILGGVNYLSYFFPSMAGSSLPKFIIVIAVVWFYTILNIVGIKQSSGFNLIVTVIKLLPLIVIVIVGALNFDPANFNTVSDPSVKGMGVIPLAMTYTLWSFLGFEGIAVNISEVKNPKMIMKGTVIGTVIVLAIYIIVTTLAAGNLPQDALAASESPFADIIKAGTGASWAGGFIAITVAISAFGCIGAWMISAASIAYSLGEEGLMPKTFMKLHPTRKTPINALLINGVLMTIVIGISFLGDMKGAIGEAFGSLYNIFLLLSTVALLIFYALGAASEMTLAARGIKEFSILAFLKNSCLSLIAFIYAVFTIWGSGGLKGEYAVYVMVGFLLLLIGIPFYVYVRSRRWSDGDHSEAR
jgi:amino acid transporter